MKANAVAAAAAAAGL
ncbi:hypothetical protein NL359_38285, partial [Klebsiella pneumoniae]|nr:hypothetical protein [Klebsiella pneumoniae]